MTGDLVELDAAGHARARCPNAVTPRGAIFIDVGLLPH
jgi:hypothetical protein